MILNCKEFAGACACGEPHSPATRLAVVEAGCLDHFDRYMAQCGLSGQRAAIYDENTYQAAGMIRPPVDQEIVLPAEGLRADESAIAAVLDQLSQEARVLVAVGSGTVSEIVRYCAHRLGLSFVSCPTAASNDGYAAAACSVFRRGRRVLLPGIAPALILADVNVLARAPRGLTLSGLGEALGKWTALADWQIASILTGTALCPAVESMLRQAAVAAQGCCERLGAGDTDAIAQLMYGLLLSGLALQLAGEAAQGFGAEQRLSHLLELRKDPGSADRVRPGEAIGVLTFMLAEYYHQLASVRDIAPHIRPCAPPDADGLKRWAGEAAAHAALSENAADCLAKITPARLAERWEKVCGVIAQIPAREELSRALATAGAKHTLKDIGLTGADVPRLLPLAPLMDNRLTLLRLSRMLDLRYESSAKASRQPSRSKRYAESAMTRAGSNSPVSASSMR